MNLTKILGDAVTPPSVIDEKEAARQQVEQIKEQDKQIEEVGFNEWLQHPVTRRLLVLLEAKAEEENKVAHQLAQDVNDTRTHLLIVKHLNNATTLEKVINYVETRKW